MSFIYKLHPEAQKEYEDSVIWYADRNLSAAVGFVNSIERALKVICNYPLLWRNEYKHFYEYNLKKYPFTVIYFIENSNQTIIVSAIYHQKRIPVKSTESKLN